MTQLSNNDNRSMLKRDNNNKQNSSNSSNRQDGNDRKQGFQVIWFYCYLKYFQNKQSQQSNKKQQQFYNKSPMKQKQQQKIVKNNYLINTQQPQQQLPQHQHQQQQQPLTFSKITQQLKQLKQTYCIETIERHSQQYSLNSIKERALLSRNDRFFVIEPEQEIKEIQQMIREASMNIKNDDMIMESCLQDMVMELYSYYLNNKNVYLIYKRNNVGSSGNNNNSSSSSGNNIITMTGNINSSSNNNNSNSNTIKIATYENSFISSMIDSTENRLKMMLTHNSSQSKLNTSKDSKCASVNDQRNERRSYGSLKSRLERNNNNSNNNTNKMLQEDSIIGCNLVPNNNNFTLGGESLTIGEGDKMDHKIQQMEVIDKFDEFDGLQLWNIKYKKIPHTFVKFKKQSWTKCLNLPLIHPSVPKTINELPIIPRLTKLNPSIDKLLPFVSLIKMLEKYFPNLLPSIQSIYEYNNMPYVFFEQDNGYCSWKWQTNIGVLCYYVVYGNDEQTLSIKKVQRWVQQNGQTLLGKTIKQMTKRQKEKNRKRKQVLRNVNLSNNININVNINSRISNNNNEIDTNTTTNNSKENNLSNNNNNSININNNQVQTSLISSSTLQMLITTDESSDLAIW